MNLNKGISIPIIIVIIIVLILLVFGGIFAYQYYYSETGEGIEQPKNNGDSQNEQPPENISIKIVLPYKETVFNLENKSFETEDFTTKKKFLVKTNSATKFYMRVDDKIIENGYKDFFDFADTMQNCIGIGCPLVPTVEGVLQGDNVIIATDVYSWIQ